MCGGGNLRARAYDVRLPNPTPVCPYCPDSIPPGPLPLLVPQVERFPDLAAEREAWEKEQAAKRRAGAVVSGPPRRHRSLPLLLPCA